MATVSIRYQLKVPASAEFSMKGTEVEISQEVPDEAVDEALSVLTTTAKLATFTSLGVAFHEDADGILQPTVEAREIPTYQAPKPQQRQQGSTGGNNQQRTPGKAAASGVDKRTLPRVELDYFDTGEAIAFIDQRSLKESGVYAPNAADFVSVDRFDLRGDGKQRNISLWLEDKNGKANETTVELLALSGVSA